MISRSYRLLLAGPGTLVRVLTSRTTLSFRFSIQSCVGLAYAHKVISLFRELNPLKAHTKLRRYVELSTFTSSWPTKAFL